VAVSGKDRYPVTSAPALDELLRAATKAVLPYEDTRQPSDLPFVTGSRVGVLYAGGWTFEIAGETAGQQSDEFGEIEYAVTGADPTKMKSYEPRPNLVVDFVNLTTNLVSAGPYHPQVADAAAAITAHFLGISPDALQTPPTERRLHPIAARTFLEKYGPLTLSGPWKGQLRIPAESLAETFDAANENDLERALRISLRMFQEAPQGSLLAALSIQAAARLFRGRVPRRCPACQTFFTEATGGYQRPEDKKWHRSDSIYCSPRCRTLINTRNYRQRQAERKRKS
jgi:hypothetical protein